MSNYIYKTYSVNHVQHMNSIISTSKCWFVQHLFHLTQLCSILSVNANAWGMASKDCSRNTSWRSSFPSRTPSMRTRQLAFIVLSGSRPMHRDEQYYRRAIVILLIETANTDSSEEPDFNDTNLSIVCYRNLRNSLSSSASSG